MEKFETKNIKEYKCIFNASEHMVKHSSCPWQDNLLFLSSQRPPCGHGEHDKNNTCKQFSLSPPLDWEQLLSQNVVKDSLHWWLPQTVVRFN